MLRHLIRDAHGLTTEIRTVLIHNVAKPQPRKRAWDNEERNTLWSFTQVQVSSGKLNVNRNLMWTNMTSL